MATEYCSYLWKQTVSYLQYLYLRQVFSLLQTWQHKNLLFEALIVN